MYEHISPVNKLQYCNMFIRPFDMSAQRCWALLNLQINFKSFTMLLFAWGPLLLWYNHYIVGWKDMSGFAWGDSSAGAATVKIPGGSMVDWAGLGSPWALAHLVHNVSRFHLCEAFLVKCWWSSDYNILCSFVEIVLFLPFTGWDYITGGLTKFN